MHRCLCDFVTEVFQNAVEAGASEIRLSWEIDGELWWSEVADNGPGMDSRQLERARDPFGTDGAKHPGRRVGLGLPLAIQTAELTGGTCGIDSLPGAGTRITMRFDLRHVDTPPVGDTALTVSQLMALPGDFEAEVSFSRRENPRAGWKGYRVRRSELREILGRFDDPGALTLMKHFFRSGESESLEGGD